MNTLILKPNQFTENTRAALSERQTNHIKTILKLSAGENIKIGALNGKLGEGVYEELNKQGFIRDIVLGFEPPPTLPLTLILALPRPQMLKRILQTVACFGVEKLVLIHSNRVEKSFWQSPAVQPEAIREQLLIGLEQANATQLPEVFFYKRFKAFIEDECPTLTQHTDKILLHPGPYPLMQKEPLSAPASIAIGPEGGFTEYECERWLEFGFQPAQLGQRILRVETAVTSALARLIG